MHSYKLLNSVQRQLKPTHQNRCWDKIVVGQKYKVRFRPNKTQLGTNKVGIRNGPKWKLSQNKCRTKINHGKYKI